MTETCQHFRDALGRGPNDPLHPTCATHLETCRPCQAHAQEHDRLVAALRIEPAPIDDMTRARWLARMAPTLDQLAEQNAPRRAARRGAWIAMIAGATVAACLGWWVGHRAPSSERAGVRTPAVVALDRELLRPYVVSGDATDAIAATLLAGRLSALEIAEGQLVRASFDHDPRQRLAAIGPAHVAVTSATTDVVELDLVGTLLVDARAPGEVIRIHVGAVTLHAQHATFSVQTGTGAPVVFVDRGEILLGTTRLGPGEWLGPVSARSAAVVALLRDHANAMPPPIGRGGVVVVEGVDRIVTQAGAILGTGPLWARLDAGEHVLVVTDTIERRAQLAVRDGAIVRLPTAVTTAPVATSTPVATRTPVTPARRAPDRTSPRSLPPPPEASPTSPRISVAGADRTPAVEPVAAISPSTAPETAQQLYATAESALRAGDHDEAQAIWSRLLATYPRSVQAASALYDLANLARARADRPSAQAYLARLLAGSPTPALREPATYASCRLHVEAGEHASATTCFTAFRTRFAGSSHDAEVLAWLAGRAQEAGGCAAARTLTTEYLRRYPRGPFAARAATCKDTK